jgi:hypothetical protein
MTGMEGGDDGSDDGGHGCDGEGANAFFVVGYTVVFDGSGGGDERTSDSSLGGCGPGGDGGGWRSH